MAIRDWGRNIKLETPDAVRRRAELAQEHPHKYEHTDLSPNGRKDATPVWFYFIAQGSEVDQIVDWVTCGTGEKPNGVRTI